MCLTENFCLQIATLLFLFPTCDSPSRLCFVHSYSESASASVWHLLLSDCPQKTSGQWVPYTYRVPDRSKQEHHQEKPGGASASVLGGAEKKIEFPVRTDSIWRCNFTLCYCKVAATVGARQQLLSTAPLNRLLAILATPAIRKPQRQTH